MQVFPAEIIFLMSSDGKMREANGKSKSERYENVLLI